MSEPELVCWPSGGCEFTPVCPQGQRFYLWRAVDQDGDVIDILVTKRRDRRAARRFFRRALKHQGQAPWQLITDKLRSYPTAHREIFPSVVHRTGQYENNRAEVSHQHTREQERQMRRFKSMAQTQRFLAVHGPIQTCSESVVTISKLFIIDSSEPGLVPIGER